ncbi:carbohydrate kinase, thermoresistant glucokinase family [Opitutaceae bacterium TAV1]|nr:carbohydrate kinase, thermoresistant glucokinase family [Opitutaceae bacterium TAV1]
MPIVPGLRSPFHKVGRLVYFARMIDKIRLHAAGRLPADYLDNLGDARPGLFDARCCRFLGVAYADLCARALEERDDEALLAWCHERGAKRSEEECEIWNAFLSKRGWRDEAADMVRQRARESGLEDRPIETMFDYLDFDEGRDPAVSRALDRPGAIRVIVVMGVAGSGKTTVGRALASALSAATGAAGGWSFLDADDFHPAANVKKMASGQPLTDADREPWLAALRTRLAEMAGAATPVGRAGAGIVDSGKHAVLACSALRRSYRDTLAAAGPRGAVAFAWLKATPATLRARLETRAAGGQHFMRAVMLESQLATLESPARGEALALETEAATVPEIVTSIRHGLGLEGYADPAATAQTSILKPGGNA